ncbi:YqaJ viral recombinase family protein [uncultured Azohydromonas sp.]|jgi:Phage-related protein, predicted endonuclease|uniref:YqaJ viral recombinase family nuclease n=1 Tax=uncultured Azohydromonas sp. TaxID=487342 RepID=UPI002622E441|nr:YqaJ viral recombinase family protein [uncultured Azohydromonas sp.]
MLSEAQKALRRTGVGASECAAALGLSPYQTRFELYQVKRGEAPEPEDNLAMRFGLAAEPFILSEFQRAHPDDLLVVAPDTMRRGRLFAHLDAWVPGRFTVQAKTARTRNGWGESGSSDIPQHYLLQVQQELLLSGEAVSFVPVLFGGADYDEFVVEADRELQELIEDGIADFWALVERGEPPEPVTLDDMLERFGRASRAEQVMADAEVLRAARELHAIKAQREQLDATEAALKARLMGALGEADTLVDATGQTLATWKATKPARRFDAAAFEAAHPALYREFLRTGEPGRQFRLKD